MIISSIEFLPIRTNRLLETERVSIIQFTSNSLKSDKPCKHACYECMKFTRLFRTAMHLAWEYCPATIQWNPTLSRVESATTDTNEATDPNGPYKSSVIRLFALPNATRNVLTRLRFVYSVKLTAICRRKSMRYALDALSASYIKAFEQFVPKVVAKYCILRK